MEGLLLQPARQFHNESHLFFENISVFAAILIPSKRPDFFSFLTRRTLITLDTNFTLAYLRVYLKSFSWEKYTGELHIAGKPRSEKTFSIDHELLEIFEGIENKNFKLACSNTQSDKYSVVSTLLPEQYMHFFLKKKRSAVLTVVSRCQIDVMKCSSLTAFDL